MPQKQRQLSVCICTIIIFFTKVFGIVKISFNLLQLDLGNYLQNYYIYIYIYTHTHTHTHTQTYMYVLYLMTHKTHPNFSRANQEKQSTNVKHDEINIMNIINDNTFNLHNSLLNNDNR